MIAKKPSIFIYSNGAGENYLKEICAGIEEEGVFYEISERESDQPDRFAFEAARDSMLGSGIGVSKEGVVLQMRGLRQEEPVESCSLPTKEECRRIGANSARIIKRMALKE